MSDTYGAGSEDFDAALGAVVPKDVRARAKLSVRDMLAKPGSMKATLPAEKEQDSAPSAEEGSGRGIFDGLVVYVNGSTAPLVSDHKLKRVLADNGANMSLHLGRRQVTHVMVGRPAGGTALGAGGGLAGGKLEKEIKKIRGCGIKFVGVEW